MEEEARLELILSFGGAKDAAGAARKLITEFGGLGAVLVASRRRLSRAGADRAGLAAIEWIHGTMMAALQHQVLSSPVLPDWQSLAAYLHAQLAHAPHEHFRVIYLDHRHRVIRDDELAEGSVDFVAAQVRPVMIRALELGAAGLILVHNHPAGDPRPSRTDLDLTRDMIAAGRTLGVCVHEHLIISSGGVANVLPLLRELRG